MRGVVKGRRVVYVAVIAIAILALIGATLAILYASSPGLALFELITFGIGVTALLLAVVGSVNSAHQIRVTRRISQKIHRAVGELEDIDRTNDAIRRRLNQDYALAKDIAEALSEAGVIEDDAKRRDVAGKIERKVRTKVKAKSKLKPRAKSASRAQSKAS